MAHGTRPSPAARRGGARHQRSRSRAGRIRRRRDAGGADHDLTGAAAPFPPAPGNAAAVRAGSGAGSGEFRPRRGSCGARGRARAVDRRVAPGSYRGRMTSSAEKPQLTKTDEEWRAQLSPEEYAALRQAGTERPWTGEYVDTKTVGVYTCRACGAELFRSETKFDSHCGWPSFYEASAEDKVILREYPSYGMMRTEVLCGTCHSHLGHLFDDAPQTPTGDRYCINSVSIRLQPAE